eukprot:TRINITY_DN430_c0_g1_i2.p1 TRINITY_DN430_c0_g1~~TRINITY_DN430_c0_g1_i2.p1  ORF type:complete len:570 (-),score=128.72 TRINITY_DN430_c0_g1_i2:627-2336(-)
MLKATPRLSALSPRGTLAFGRWGLGNRRPVLRSLVSCQNGVTKVQSRLFSVWPSQQDASCDVSAKCADRVGDVVRTRMAPSPTGRMHLGGLRTALFNYVFAKRHGGKFILRVEDTDRKRTVPGSLESLCEGLLWAGLPYDEGPDVGGHVVGGDYGPYIQSERQKSGIYEEHADRLVESGHAYRCYCGSDRLQELREKQQRRGRPVKYDRRCLHLTEEEKRKHTAEGAPYTVRLLIPLGETVVDDLVRGRVQFKNNFVDDPILLKADRFPTYHLASVVDDHLMRISHVIRGEEWLISVPKHISLYHAFGWEPPVYAHLPLLLNQDKSKLSKRQDDISVEWYRDRAYLPEAINNFSAFLGWTPPDGKDILTMDDIIANFRLSDVHKAGGVVDPDRLRWISGEHLRREVETNLTSVAKRAMPFVKEAFPDSPLASDEQYVARALATTAERVHVVSELPEQSSYCFRDPDLGNVKAAFKRKAWTSANVELVREVDSLLRDNDSAPEWTGDSLVDLMKGVCDRAGVRATALFMPLRYALTGTNAGPPMHAVMELLGRDTCLRRLSVALNVPVSS